MRSGDLEDTIVPRPASPLNKMVYVLFDVSCRHEYPVEYQMSSVHATEESARRKAKHLFETNSNWRILRKHGVPPLFAGMTEQNNYTLVGYRNVLDRQKQLSSEGAGFLIEVHSLD